MTTKMVLIVSHVVPAATRDAIATVIKEESAGYWHWYQHAWLISDSYGRSIQWWRDRIKEKVPGATMMIVAAAGGWTGFTSENHYDWMYETWDKD